ncbi:MAG: hypothetical protein AAF909_05200 [Pseudomonadota bacterium]
MVIDAIGIVGVALVVCAYFLLQTERLTINDLSYSLLNLIGSAMILLTLFYTFNLASFVIEIFWLGISLIGVARHLRAA